MTLHINSLQRPIALGCVLLLLATAATADTSASTATAAPSTVLPGSTTGWLGSNPWTNAAIASLLFGAVVYAGLLYVE